MSLIGNTEGDRLRTATALLQMTMKVNTRVNQQISESIGRIAIAIGSPPRDGDTPEQANDTARHAFYQIYNGELHSLIRLVQFHDITEQRLQHVVELLTTQDAIKSVVIDDCEQQLINMLEKGMSVEEAIDISSSQRSSTVELF